MSLPDIPGENGGVVNAEALAIAEEMNKLRAEMAEMLAGIQAATDEVKSLNSDAAELMKEAEARRAAARVIESGLFDVKRKIKQHEREISSAERRMQQAMDNARLVREFESATAEFEALIGELHYAEDIAQHQIDGARKLAFAERGILGDVMGLGKTLTILATADMVQAKKILVFAPATVVRTFEAEIARWAPHRNIMSLSQTTKVERRFIAGLLPKMDEFIVTINYEAWRKDAAFLDELLKAQFQMVICDEAHNIKDRESIAFRGVNKICYTENVPCEIFQKWLEIKQQDYYMRPAGFDSINPPECEHNSGANDGKPFAHCSVKYVYPMTGTPILNKPQDLFALLHLVDRENFSNERHFLIDYCVQDWETGKWNFAPGGLDRLAKKIGGRFVRRTKDSAGIKLPAKTIQYHDVQLTAESHPNQWRANEMLNQQAAIILDENTVMPVQAMIALITRKRQMMTWPAGIQWIDKDKDSPTFGKVLFSCDVEESCKVDYAEELIDEISLDEKIVLFSQFKTPLREISRRLKKKGYTVATIDGETPMQERQDIIDRFQNKALHAADGIDILLGNYKAMGVGVTLTAATQMILLDLEWNAGKEDQAIDRIHRIGQDKPVTIHILQVQNSVDTWMRKLVEQKRDMVDGFIQSTDIVQQARDELFGGGFI